MRRVLTPVVYPAEYTCLTLAVNVRSERSGFVVSRVSRVSYSVLRSASTTRYCWRSQIQHVSCYYRLSFCLSDDIIGNVESNGLVSPAVQERHQLTVVPPHIDNIIPRQDWRIQESIAEGLFKLPFLRSSLSGLTPSSRSPSFGRFRCKNTSPSTQPDQTSISLRLMVFHAS